jgi:hypothetical protein
MKIKANVHYFGRFNVIVQNNLFSFCFFSLCIFAVKSQYHYDMAELKTKQTGLSVEKYIEAIPDEQRRADCRTVIEMMKKITGDEPKMWGETIVGFGNVHLKYESGRELDWFKTGFSNRKDAITIYSMYGFISQPELLKKLGKVKTGKGCLYIRKLSDIDINVLEEMIVNYLKNCPAQ